MAIASITTGSQWLDPISDNTVNTLHANTGFIDAVVCSTINGVPFSGSGIGNVAPSVTDTYNLGSASKRWLNGYIKNVISDSVTANSGTISAITCATINGLPATGGSIGNIVPSIGDTYSLGDPDHKFLNTYSINLYGQLAESQTTLNATTVNATTLHGQLADSQTTINATTVSATSLGGTLTTALQPNITTLDGVTSVNGSTFSNVGMVKTITTDNLAGTLTTPAQPNITSIGTLSALLTTQTITPASNLTYSIGGSSAKYNEIYAVSLYGAVQDASQTNITALGTLNSLTVSGDIKPNSNGAISIGDNSHYFNNGYINNLLVGNQLTLEGFGGTTGILHSNMFGVVSTSQIVNDDVSPSAAIVDTKLAQITTTNKVSNSATSATATLTNGAIVARDGSGGFLAAAVGVSSLAVGSLGTVLNTSGSNLIFQNPTANGDIIMQMASGGSANFQIKNSSNVDIFSIYDYGTIFTQTIIPHTDVTYDLGSSGSRFRNFYANTATISDVLTAQYLTTTAGISTFNSANATNQLVLNNTGATTNRSNFYVNNANKRDFEIGLRGSSDTYVPYCYSNNTATTGRSTWVWLCDTDLNLQTNGVFPLNDNAYNLGSGGSRWGTVYAATGTINTSDARVKENIVASNLGLNLIELLEPVSYKFKNYVSPGIPDNNGNPTADINHTFTRTHYGFTAQQLKSCMDQLGLTTNDFAAYIYDTASDTYGIRYEELISPIVKSIKELNAKINIVANHIGIQV